MKFYEKENVFYLLEEDEKPPLGVKQYQINFPFTIGSSSAEVFPQYELKIYSYGGWGYSSNWEITYKKQFSFSPSVSNRANYIIRLLNDLNTENYEDVILKYIKDAVKEEEYLEIKANLNKLNSVEQIKLDNINLKNELYASIEEKSKLEGELKVCNNMNQELEDCKNKLELIEKKLANTIKYKIRKFFRLGRK